MLKKMTSSDSMTNSVENNKKGAGVIRFFTSMPLSIKLLLLVVIALIPRIIALLQPQIITIDGTLYISMAKLFAEGKYAGTSSSYFSLYPFLIFLVQKFIGDWELSGQLISIVLGTLTVIPIFLLGRSLYNEKIGWLSASFYITLPNLLRFDSQVIRDPTLWFFILFTIWLVWEGNKENRPILFALASISAGLGVLTRVEGFIIWGVLGFYIGFKKVVEISLKRKVVNLSLFILIFPLLLSITLFSFKKGPSGMALGEMTSFSLKFITAHAQTMLKPRDPIRVLEQKTYGSLPQLSQDSLELASRHRIVLAISEVIYKSVKSANLLIILILIGFWQRRKEGFKSSDWYLLYVFAALFCMSVFYCRQIYYFSTRHGLTLVLPTLFFSGYGLHLIAERFSQGLNRLTSGWSIVRKYLLHLLTIFFIIIFLVEGISFKRTDKFIQKEIGFWLKENGYQGSVVMGPEKFLRLAFYLDGRFVEMPSSWEKAIDSIRKNGVGILVVDSCTIEEDCPGFFANRSSDGFLILREIKEKGRGCLLQIYQVR
jgi:4-amino-4-deoxy-L-arabinose transferase-like glycosyltransferase